MGSTRVYSCPRCEKKMKAISVQQVFPIHMKPKQDTLMLKQDNDASENFGFYKDEKSTLEEQDIERDYIDFVGKSSDIGSYTKDML